MIVNAMLHSTLSYLGLVLCAINEVSCNNASQTQSFEMHQSSLLLGGRFGYVSAGIAITGFCISTLAYIYKNLHTTHESEPLRCIGQNYAELNEWYDL